MFAPLLQLPGSAPGSYINYGNGTEEVVQSAVVITLCSGSTLTLCSGSVSY